MYKKMCGWAVAMCVCAMCLTACSGNDYLHAIPATATAIVRLRTAQIADKEAMESAVRTMLPVENIAESGIDCTSDIYAFETVDGNFGLCAKIKDADTFADTVDKLAGKGKCSKARKQGKFRFSDVDNAWAVGFSDKSLVVMGPVSAATLPDAQRRIAGMLRQDEEASIVARPMFEKLDSLEGNLTMVAQAQALPEKLVAPLTIGTPKDADASQVLIAASFDRKDGVVSVTGETFSFSKSIDAELKKAQGVLRKINGNYTKAMPAKYMFGLFANVEGKAFLPLLQGNKQMQALLAGLNTAIDFDNILRSVDGDLAIMSNGLTADNMGMTMLAHVEKPVWTADVDYWKQSCPKGNSITGDNGHWCYNSANGGFSFGLAADTFYGTTDKAMIPASSQPVCEAPMAKDVQDAVAGKRMAIVMNIDSAIGGGVVPGGIGNMLHGLLGGVKSIVYIMK